MLFETENQGFIVLSVFFIAFFVAIICEFLKLFNQKSKHKFTKVCFDFFASFSVCVFLFFLCVLLNFGEIRFYILVIYITGLTLGSFVFRKIKKHFIKQKLKKLLKKEKGMWSFSFPFPAPIF